MKVFWSWQSDRPAKLCRNVIQDALGRALIALSDELELDRSEGPELDHDTKDEAGMAAIADTIFRKIKEAVVFVGDITSAGRSESGRELPNPNVAIELGWAWANLSHENIILVANRAFGPRKHEQLPFDIRHRRAAIFYSLSKSADDAEIERVTSELGDHLRDALRASLSDWLVAKASDPGPPGRASRSGDPSTWFEAGTLLRHQPFHGGGGLHNVRPEEAPRLYVRIVPERFGNGVSNPAVVHTRGDSGLRPLGPQTSGDGGLNGDGVLRYAVGRSRDPTETWTATQWFRDTGELWTFDTARLRDGEFHVGSFITEVASFLIRGLNMLVAFGASGRLRVEVGAAGLEGTQWAGQFNYERAAALSDKVVVSEARRTWTRAEISDFLVTATGRFADAYGRPRPDAAAIKRAVSEVRV